MATLTLLKGYKPFRKHFSATTSTSYPLIKTVTSQTVEYEISNAGLRAKTAALQHAATEGLCMLKGPLLQPLVAESRAGKSDKNALTRDIILDLDGLKLPGCPVPTTLDKIHLHRIAEAVIQELPEIFHNTSYILHASARMGMKPDHIRLHLDFATDEAIAPAKLKQYLTALNMTTPWLFKNTALSATGKALLFPLDRCLADNSRLIFIGHPSFTDIPDPIPDTNERIFFVEKANATMAISAAIEAIDPVVVDKQCKKRILELRAAANLPDQKEKTQRIKVNGEYINLITNPDQGSMSFFQDHGNYVTYNFNDGDSHGYFVKKSTPHIVWNFKGEPPFLFQQADPDCYAWHLEQYPITEGHGRVEPFVFRDIETNTFYNGLYNRSSKRIEFLKPSDRGALQSFMIENGGVMPEHPPQWRLVFNPGSPIELNPVEGTVNQWQEPPLLSELLTTPILTYGNTAETIAANCPLIHLTLLSATGDDMECYEHFINWLSFIFQTRQKTGTAWLFQGVEGTGKGVLATRVLKPMLENASKTRCYYHSMRVENLEEQFNGWLETSLIAFVDEFKAPHNSTGEKLFNKIKNYITEEFSPMRRMRRDQEMVSNRCNFIFTSNEYGPMEPGESDRRMNIAPRQERPILHRAPHYKTAVMTGLLDKEVPFFASLIMQMSFDHIKAMSALDNAAKNNLRDIAGDSTAKFCKAISEGDLSYFIELFHIVTFGATEDYRIAALNHLRTWVRRAVRHEDCVIFSRELKPAYNALVARQDNDGKFYKMLSHRGLESVRLRRDGANSRGFTVTWNITDEEAMIYSRDYLLETPTNDTTATNPSAATPAETDTPIH